MTNDRIKHILDSHGIPNFIEDGRIYADSMASGTALFEEVIDLTNISRAGLYAWLGY